MKAREIAEHLRQHGIRPSAQRVAIAGYVLATGDHPAAETVWRNVARSFPMVSRATVYNTLKLFVDKGLLRELQLAPGQVVYDPNTAPHHHFVDDADASIRDLPWAALRVDGAEGLPGIEVRELTVVVRGRRRGARDEPPTR